ncbi:hypothetical protein BH09VER1_BH09VER1_25970 [soil metagenome]
MAKPFPIYVECPHCQELQDIQWYGGEHAYWSDPWTDGKRSNWHIRDFNDELCRGYSCGKLFWTSDALPSEERASERQMAEGQGRPRGCLVKVSDNNNTYIWGEALVGMCKTPAQEIYMRMYLWWLRNDPFRPLVKPSSEGKRCRITFAQIEMGSDFVENLERLIALFDEKADPRELLLKAEALRELERFDEAGTLLEHAPTWFEEHTRRAVEAIKVAGIGRMVPDYYNLGLTLMNACAVTDPLVKMLPTNYVYRSIYPDKIPPEYQ